MDALATLRHYWKHDGFRPLQAEIIATVLSGRDTFALLPTGGGKSICFQVPAMMTEGICLVISPLVALMKDQVERLKSMGIKAMSLTGPLTTNDISDLLDNCKFGNYKFLYLSPERLQADWIIDRLKELPLSLIAVDEAHCVSQWGHDFRPAYLKIGGLRQHFPKTSIIALTATATKRVKADIILQLKLQDPQVFTASFARPNLGLFVIPTEDKMHKTAQILAKNPQPSILYVRNRKNCLRIADTLQKMGFTATYYHGGLPSREKEKNMKMWMENKAQVMVATNAFGMGIDKADVKTVLHHQLPDNLESYYQEAGRAGRNEEKAFAILLSAPSDAIDGERQFISVLPDKKFLLAVYIKLCNYLQIAYGEGLDETFPFSLNRFCSQYGFPVIKTYNALQFLDRQAVITLSQEHAEKVSAQFIIESKEVIRFNSLNPADEEVVLAMLRTYPGIYESQTALNIPLIAKKSLTDETKVLSVLEKLGRLGITENQLNPHDATLLFNEVREDEHTINRISRYLETQNELKKRQFDAVLQYAENNKSCKSRQLLSYFGEEQAEDCGQCSYCTGKKKTMAASAPELVLRALKTQKMGSRDLAALLGLPEQDIIFTLQELLEADAITVTADNQYKTRT